MRVGVFLVNVVRVVGANGFQIELFGEFQESWNNSSLDRHAVVLQLYEIVLLPENIDEVSRNATRILLVAINQILGRNSIDAAA